MGAHETHGESDEWYTPKYIFDGLGTTFDLDVAAPVDGPRYVPCRSYYHELSLILPWSGFVWMNPPYLGRGTKMAWLDKFFMHGNGIALMPDRTSSPWWQYAAPVASAILFVNGKIKFERPDGTIGEQPGNGTTLFSAGIRGRDVLRKAVNLGVCMELATNGQA